MKFLLLFIAMLFVCTSYAQQPILISAENTTLTGSGSNLPFWFTANTDGKVGASGSWLNLTDLYAGQSYSSTGSAVAFTWAANAVAGFGQTNYYQLNRAYGGISWKGWEVKGGLFYEPTLYAGLSSTNGNLVRSRNARPHPRVRFATRGYKPVPFLHDLLFRAEYDEGLLNDNRFVDNARLHHKSLYLRMHLSSTWEVECGLDHYVMWGGTSGEESIGKMPAGFKEYLQYVMGRSGTGAFPLTDQLNVAGNHLGSYTLRAKKRFTGMDATFYLNHPFEDLSGMNWRNWPDNLLGLYAEFHNSRQIITGVLYEYTHTRQQSIRGRWDRQEPDSYFNNGVYRSGFTYHRQVMGSPLFFPVVVHEGISQGTASNMLQAHHVGVKGVLPPHLRWKGMLTWTHHFGQYFNRYEPSRQQLSALLEVQYARRGLPVDLGMAAAADAGNASGRNLGLQFRISKTW